MDSKQHLNELELGGSPASPAPDNTPEELFNLDAALRDSDTRGAENLLRTQAIGANMDHKAMALYLLVAHHWDKKFLELALGIFKASDVPTRPTSAGSRAGNATAQDEKLLASIIDAEAPDGLYDFAADFRIVRDYTWRRSVSLGYSCILRTLIRSENAFDIEYTDMVALAKAGHTDILAQLVEKEEFTIVRKQKVFAHLFAVVDDIQEFAPGYTERNIHVADVISAMLDAGYSGKQIRAARKEWQLWGSLKAVLAHLIMKRKHSLFREIFRAEEVAFDVLYVKLALESDAMDTVFLIYHAYPLQFTAQLQDLPPSVLIALSRSPRFYVMKLFFLVKMLRHFSYE